MASPSLEARKGLFPLPVAEVRLTLPPPPMPPCAGDESWMGDGRSPDLHMGGRVKDAIGRE